MGLPFVRMEDAFIRSVYFGTGERHLGMVIDDLGIYYDCNEPSRLEHLVAKGIDQAAVHRARCIAEQWRRGRVSKYNHAPEYAGLLPESYVLVVDQTAGDMSLLYGQANERSFSDMLEAALDENPDEQVLLKIHPEVLSGRKMGHYDLDRIRRETRILLIGEDVHPVGLIERAASVYTVTSQVGFEALIWRKTVRTFGVPFYAGWGLTSDNLRTPSRRKPATFEELVHAALVSYARYVNPETRKGCEVEDIIAHLALQREQIERWPDKITALGFSRWKQSHVRRFFPYRHLHFRDRLGNKDNDTTAAVWSIPTTPPQTSTRITLEDGFIRSIGLGYEPVAPLSWVADLSGIYFDSSKPSDLEKLLQGSTFPERLVARAARLRQRIVDAEITKYNWGDAAQWNPPEQARGRDIILVPGQVESDASIRFGSPSVRSNYELLLKTKEKHPEAFVIYKPHPEVVTGRRGCGSEEPKCEEIADQVVARARMGQLLSAVDEVHTITSLAGFEALLRGKRVVTHGQPFYAGWGLTTDLLPVTRRTRRLALDELVAGALILYPLYISNVSGRYTTPERALEELANWDTLPKPSSNALDKLHRAVADFLRLLNPFR